MYVAKWAYQVRTRKVLRAHVKLLREHVIVISRAREVITCTREKYYVRT